MILATYSQLDLSKSDIKKDKSNITDEKPTVNKMSRIHNHRIGEGL